MANKALRLQLQRQDDQMELTVRILRRTGERSPAGNSGAKPSAKTGFLRSVSVQLNGKPVVDAQLGASMADNPRFGFKFANVQAGDTFAVLCTDDAGEEIAGEIVAGA
jgi:hypothetical protein